jgi:hypothetical protein
MFPASQKDLVSTAPRTSVIHRPKGPAWNLRIVSDDAAVLMVTAFDYEAMAEVTAHCGLAIPGAYIFRGTSAAHGGSAAYVGQSFKLRKRLLEHAADASKSFAREVYLISRRGGGLSKKDVEYLEGRLMEAVEEVGADKLVNTAPACATDLDAEREATLDKMLADCWELLFNAGCRSFVMSDAKTGATAKPDDDPDTGGEMEIGVAVPAGLPEFDLAHGSVWARGLANNERLIVLPGSVMRTRHNASIIPKVRERRERLLASGAVIPTGQDDLVRLVMPVGFPSKAIAGKVLSGAHIGSDRWRAATRYVPPAA